MRRYSLGEGIEKKSPADLGKEVEEQKAAMAAKAAEAAAKKEAEPAEAAPPAEDIPAVKVLLLGCPVGWVWPVHQKMILSRQRAWCEACSGGACMHTEMQRAPALTATR